MGRSFGFYLGVGVGLWGFEVETRFKDFGILVLSRKGLVVRCVRDIREFRVD